MRRISLLLIAMLLVGVAAFLYSRTKPVVPLLSGDATATTVKTDEVATAEKPSTVPGGIGGDGNAKAEKKNEASPETPDLGFGKVEPVHAAGNKHAESVLAALKSGKNPERLSVLQPPDAPFDKVAFEADPDAYTRVVEPGRVFQNALPGNDVPALQVQGSAYVRLNQGERAKLEVKGTPLAPVTFTSTHLGAFEESHLSSVTVRAGKDGVASATFVATPGTLNDVSVLAGSPLASGQARFTIDVGQGIAGK